MKTITFQLFFFALCVIGIASQNYTISPVRTSSVEEYCWDSRENIFSEISTDKYEHYADLTHKELKTDG